MLNKFLNKLDQFFLEINDYWEDKKRKIKFWFVDKVQTIEKFSNPTKVILASLISFCIYRYFTEQALGKETSNAYWTLATLFISSPVAFIIWHFRDKNITQQIENQRKDINLKEFQKIAEWVSGLHLVEDEVTEQFKNSVRKRIIKTQRSSNQKETTRKYPQQSEHLSIPTFSKKDGAVGLQIAAIYNLLPFYRGEHGESFKKPALNLLLSAWLSLQQKEINNLEQLNKEVDHEQIDFTLRKIRKNANSPLGIALTNILLSDNARYLLEFQDMFPNLYLAGVDFSSHHLNKVSPSLFKNISDCNGMNLMNSRFEKSTLCYANFKNSNLNYANFSRADLTGTNFNNATLISSNLYEANLERANLACVDLNNSCLNRAILEGAVLKKANLTRVSLLEVNLKKSNLDKAILYRALLNGSNLQEANLKHSILEGASFLYCNLQGANLKSANLKFSNLYGVDFQYANLSGANLQYANLDNTNFSMANLDGCIIIYDKFSNLDWNTLKKQGAVILFSDNSIVKNVEQTLIANGSSRYIHNISIKLDLVKTQQENPEWQILTI
ncbi:pentapeptide repeat-containing protein [Pasteurella multocida]|uniref:pentapeptide repeat-containing protein n=1 Tax=Pasteurella multocida TaxID=747 RepID=UPI0002569F93|nr:pentapeptide repeat-containing protein [Pasteurella multocida]AFF23873.1 hypothetical protein PMCN06_0621 [Pasteurella multocida subsp. multocida str. HN06]MCL8063829.1 pentapeptide repeat-containing protein [Pasteurella multocida]MCW4598865.1 pentapeptide repeat-containing protein [Pasteurella multocida subsp. multocida]MDY0624984.1 pentapeptide repeat-containing protein [Pasteurella multocida]MDY0668313.1 pentapeptide repeat-containing protein [Pasteurella multocida]